MRDVGTGTLTFIAQVIASLSWPVTVLTCVILLRRHLLALLPLVRTVKYSDVEIRFGKEVAEIAKSTDLTSIPEQLSGAKPEQWEHLVKMAGIRPRTAIRMAFRRVEETLADAAHTVNLEIADGAAGMPMVIGALLLNQGTISGDQFELLSKLRVLLNDAELASPDGIKPESAAEFVDLALRLAASMHELPRPPGLDDQSSRNKYEH